jgi:outer membrane protein
MNKQKIRRSILFAVFLLVSINITLTGQSVAGLKSDLVTDSMSLKTIIRQIVATHPSVKAAEEAINIADARIGLAKTGYYPEADITAGYSNLAPVTTIAIPDLGTFQLYPDNNYSASLNYRQVVYDFGRTRQNIKLENGNKEVGMQTIEQVKQKISMYAVNNFYTLGFLQASIKIKDEQIEALNEHLNYIEKMYATGSATEYQVLATKVRISTIESQKVDLVAALTAQQASLNSLLGNDQSVIPVVRNELIVEIPLVPKDSLLSYAFHNRDEMLVNQKKASLAELRLGLTKLQNKPLLSVNATGGAKNGYLPDLNKPTPNYVVGLGLKIPIYDGTKNRYNIAMAQSALTSLSYETDQTRRSISNELYEDEAYMQAAQQKIKQFELQLVQARKAYSLAETSFKSGVITNLDLLDANTAVSESELMLLKARIDFAASVYKLKAALGERLY